MLIYILGTQLNLRVLAAVNGNSFTDDNISRRIHDKRLKREKVWLLPPHYKARLDYVFR